MAVFVLRCLLHVLVFIYCVHVHPWGYVGLSTEQYLKPEASVLELSSNAYLHTSVLDFSLVGRYTKPFLECMTFSACHHRVKQQPPRWTEVTSVVYQCFLPVLSRCILPAYLAGSLGFPVDEIHCFSVTVQRKRIESFSLPLFVQRKRSESLVFSFLEV